jgi:hypothetical protein
MSNLADQFIDETFGGVLHTSSQAISSADIKRVYDGYGNETPVSMSKFSFKLGTVSYPLSAAENGTVLIHNNGVANFQKIVDVVYPIGCIYLTVGDTNPASVFGGIWNQVSKGRFLVGIGTGIDTNSKNKTFTAGDNSGEYEHIQTVDEMAPHTHNISYSLATNGFEGNPSAEPLILGGSVQTQSSGGGQPFNVTPPSFGVYVWQRTS